MKVRQINYRCKRVFEADKLAYANRTRESITCQQLSSRDIWQFANSVLIKGISGIPPLFDEPEVLFSHSDKAKVCAKNFSKNSNLDDSGISVAAFLTRTNLKLHGVHVTPKLVKKVIRGNTHMTFMKIV